MPKFEKQYVHFMWDDDLKGKKVFYSDHIFSLQGYVENNMQGYCGIVSGEGIIDKIFRIDDNNNWVFVYYDPWYELKLAYEQGKTIQVFENGIWCDYLNQPSWTIPPEAYRVKPEEKPITNRELARWIALGNGEWKYKNDGFHNVKFSYPIEVENTPIEDMILVRKWEDEDWVFPTREYMGLEV